MLVGSVGAHNTAGYNMRSESYGFISMADQFVLFFPHHFLSAHDK